MNQQAVVKQSEDLTVVVNISPFPIRMETIRIDTGETASIPKKILQSSQAKMLIDSGLLAVKSHG